MILMIQLWGLFVLSGCLCLSAPVEAGPAVRTAASTLKVELPPHPFEGRAMPDSPFGINTAFGPTTANLERRIEAMCDAGIKWGRQDFVWK